MSYLQVVGAPFLAYSLSFRHCISGLHQTYYVRVAALGDVAAQQVNPTGDPPDNTNWSGVIEAAPADQPPSSPGPVSLYVLDGSTLQVTLANKNLGCWVAVENLGVDSGGIIFVI